MALLYSNFHKELQPMGEMVYIEGSYDFVVPAGVYFIHTVALGAGGGGYANTTYESSGAGGGALAWVNNIPVTPGETLKVIAGSGGSASNNVNYMSIGTGDDSTIHRGATMLCGAGGGGREATHSDLGINPGGLVLVGSGGAGGAGRSNILATSHAQGGGGAGGYSGAGGAAGVGDQTSVGANGSGGAGAGGANSTNYLIGQAGSVSLFGEGASGVGTVYSSSGSAVHGSGYLHPRDGSSGNASSIGYTNQAGYAYWVSSASPGAGGGALAYSSTLCGAQQGGSGAVRIIWGQGRAFPSTNVGPS
ncbi:MAG: hypothetical protein PF440_08815 [Thiomicrorhabdus sp.]|jgi:hypothetical protein|nr:hypothetical protein [Thiomicrorhabdus sp.]